MAMQEFPQPTNTWTDRLRRLQAMELLKEILSQTNFQVRQREGIDIALQKGIPFGRPKKEIPDNFFDECRKWLEGEQTAVITMKKTGLKKTTFYRMVNENMREISVKC